MVSSRTIVPIALALAASSVCEQSSAFVSPLPSFASSVSIQQQKQQHNLAQQQQTCLPQRPSFQLFSTTDTDLEEEIKSMRVGAIKQELESYGISTRTFLEKRELVDALVQARKDGKTPVATAPSPSPSPATTTASASTTTSTSSSTSSSTSTVSGADRQARIQEEMEKAKSQKVGELKSELESYGVSTNTFFEKTEFVRAVAEARVDGATATKKSKKKKRRVAVDDDDVEEVTAKVEVITNDSEGPKTKKTRDAADAGAGGNPFGGAGGNPFGGAGGGGGASPFGGGGMGGMDMGNIADMLKGMGGMGGGGGGGNPFAGAAGAGGGNPFAGAGGAPGGGNPFGGGAGMGDAMKAAQEAMSNPKVMAVIQKAQKNPKVMAAVQECMGNPMAMSKYMSDPEVGPILKELQEAMM